MLDMNRMLGLNKEKIDQSGKIYDFFVPEPFSNIRVVSQQWRG